MNIYNLNNKVVVHIDELEGDIPVLDFAIYKYDYSDCLSNDVFLAGAISQNDKTFITLPDGKYNILVIDPLGVYADIRQDFYVYYNTLPRFVCEIRKLACNQFCNNCNKSSLEDILKLFFEITIYLNCTGLIDKLSTYRYLSCKLNSTLATSKQMESLYGKFKYDYEKSLFELFIIFLTELHEISLLSNREDNDHVAIINNMFRLEEIKTCLNTSSINFNYLDTLINPTNCTCYE